MKFEYKSTNFISKFKEDDKRIKIYDKNKILKYNIEPDFDYSFLNNNCIILKIVNKNDIRLSFENKSDAIIAYNKLLSYKSMFDNNFISNNTGNKFTYSTKNLNMVALNTSGTTMSSKTQLACETPVLDIPSSMIRVYVNGIDVNVGNPLLDNNSVCFFAPYSGLTLSQALLMAREKGKEKKGDYLYWLGEEWEFNNIQGPGSGYDLDINDMIDFVYLTSDDDIDNDMFIYSVSNINMSAVETNKNGDFACLVPILEQPEYGVDVLVNGTKVKSGNPLVDNDVVCYFVPGNNLSGIMSLFSVRNKGYEKTGDYLYWIGDNWILDGDNLVIEGAGYELTLTDKIDFIYKTKKN